MSKLGNVSLGNILSVEPKTSLPYTTRQPIGEASSIAQHNSSQTRQWLISGCLHNPSQAEVEQLKALQNGEVLLRCAFILLCSFWETAFMWFS